MSRLTRVLLLLALFCVVPGPARGAVITDVLSSFDDEDPFDINLSLTYDFNFHNTLITREALSQGRIVPANKLEADRMWHTISVGMAIGLYHELELVVDLPIVAADRLKVNAHPSLKDDSAQCGGDALYSSCLSDIDPSPQAYNFSDATRAGTLFDIPFSGNERSGLGDLGIGLRWAPWHYDRDPEYPSWVLGVLMRIPTAEVKKATNSAVGEGLFQIELNTAISRRVTSFFEPYFDLHGKLRFATDRSLFDQESDDTQTLSAPGHMMGLKLGAEFIPWEVPGEDRHVAINLGGGLDYVFEGREYSELWEALGSSPCRTSNDCTMTTYTRGPQGVLAQEGQAALQSDYANDVFPRTDGITDVEHYAFFSFWTGLDIQPIEYLQIGLQYKLAYFTPHFITFADAGKDSADSDPYVNAYGANPDKPEPFDQPYNEYNPKYIEALDEVGNRFRASRSLLHSFMFTMTGRF